ncbi:MAG TPA: pitrilysin family protein [bacterium]|nr:pitrilysin family protein [bacterium]
MRKIRILAVLLAVLVPFPARSAGEKAALQAWADRVQEVKLANGLKFLLYPRGEAPIFTATIRFKAGGLDEEAGKTGLAHFLEHMAFKGTERLGTKDYAKEKPILNEIEKTGEALAAEYRKGGKSDAAKIRTLREDLKGLHDKLVPLLEKEQLAKMMLENGGSDYNATTSKDMTTYYVSLPSDKIRFWAEIESERIFKPVFREFYEEKDVVLEERRLRVDNDPDGRLYEAFIQTAFPEGPYHSPTIGSAQDVLGLTAGDLRAFFEKFYRPENMSGAIVGRFDPGEVKKILEETFGRVTFNGNAQPPETRPAAAVVLQEKERRVSLKLQARPRILIGYRKPTLPDDDDFVFDLIDQILGDGRSSRFYRSLVLEKRLAASVSTSTGIPGSRLPNLFMIEVSPLNDGTSGDVIKALDEEIEKIRTEGVTERELTKAKNRLTVDLLWQLKTNEGLASQLTYFETVAGNWRYLAEYLEKIGRFGPEDVRRVAQKYLQPGNRTVGVLEP